MKTKAQLVLASLLFLALVPGACVRDIEPSKLKCVDNSNCPSTHACVRTPDKSSGSCVPKTSLPASSDSSVSDTRSLDTKAGSGGAVADAAKGGGGAVAGSGGAITASGGAVVGSGGAIVGSGGTIGQSGGTTPLPDADIPSTTPDAPVTQPGSDAAPSLPVGGACQTGDQCASGFCVDGVCCSGKCDGQCESCKETGSIGTCKARKGDPLSPRGACVGTAACKGQCDGTNAKTCVFPDDKTICTAATCSAGKVTTASVCNGAGTCTASTSSTCGSNACATDGSGKCSGSCTATSCGTTAYCDASSGACVPTLDNGKTCSTNTQCTSGICSLDGVCCDAKCDGQCESCKEAASLGKCKAVTGTPVGSRAACTGTGTCKGTCDGANAKTCAYPAAATTCSTASCTNGVATPAAGCDGAGACSKATAAPCSSNLCATDGSGTCAAKCTATSCGTNSYCNSAGSCVGKKSPGALCSSAGECSTGFCSPDGVCCDSACTGQCQACNAQGQCGRISGAPMNGRTPCISHATCGGSCMGTSDSCVYPASEKTCTAAGCSSDLVTATTASVCNGSGACTTAQSTNCSSSSRFCSGGGCISKLADGGTCQQNIQCAGGGCCGGQCVTTATDRNNCGGCNRPCSGNQVCTAGTCGCSYGTLMCGSCAGWNFESNSTEGWRQELNTSGITSVRPSSLRRDTGSYSLEVTVSVTIAETISFMAPFCSSAQGMSLNGYRFSARLFFDTSDGTGGMFGLKLSGSNGEGYVGALDHSFTAGIWNPVEVNITDTGLYNEIGINFYTMASIPWNAKIYMDNARLYKP